MHVRRRAPLTPRGRPGIAALPWLILAAACAATTPEPEPVVATDAGTRTSDGAWNDAALLDWVAGLAEESDRYGELETVASFERLQATIEEVKQLVLADARSEQEAVEGLRMILKHLAVSTNDTLNRDFRNPLFAKRDPREREIGAYNPDAEYDQALIDGRFDYRITGDLGTVPYLSITINGRAEGRISEIVGYLDDAAIREHATPDGRITIWLTKQSPDAPGAWIPLPDSANGVVIRQYVADRTRDALARFAIEAIGDPLPVIDPVPDEEVALRLDYASDYLAVSSTWHRTLLPEIRERPNRFVPSTGSAIGASAANRENYYQMAYYEIEPGEALVIDFEPPSGTPYWNLTSATFWHESHRHWTDPASLTSSEVTYEKDGRVRFVVSREDPAHPNWIRTFAHERGFLILRMPGVDSHPLPVVRRVRLSRRGSCSGSPGLDAEGHSCFRLGNDRAGTREGDRVDE